MKITERRLRSIIRSVIKESIDNHDPKVEEVEEYVKSYIKDMGRMLNREWADTSYSGNTDRKYMLKMLKYREVCQKEGIDMIEVNNNFYSDRRSAEDPRIEQYGLDRDAIERYNYGDKFSIDQLKSIISKIDQIAMERGVFSVQNPPMEIDPDTNKYIM